MAQSLITYLTAHPQLTADGVAWPVAHETGERIGYRWQKDAAHRRASVRLYSDGSEAQLKLALRKFAATTLERRTHTLAEPLKLSVGRVQIRDQRSRWGSCSSRTTLSLNWRLILLPPTLCDYVIHHELAHLTEMNHSSAFWMLLNRYHPDARRVDRELTRIGRSIFALGRSEP